MHEFELIERYFTHKTAGAGVILGVGDDGAVLRVSPGRDLVAVVDTLVAGVHFPQGLAAADIGYRALAVNLSDIAAMGGVPRWFTLALTLPAADPAWLEEFAGGLFDAARESSVALVGGDTTSGSQLVISVQLLGDVVAGAFLTRSGCQPEDRIYVSGTLGDAAAGLARLPQEAGTQRLAQRFRRPTARVRLGQALVGIATAAIDVSDGLHADLNHVLRASNCGASLQLERLPLSAELLAQCSEAEAVQLALSGGDDYELVFCVSAAQEARVQQIAHDLGEQITCIGNAEHEQGLRLTHRGTPYTAQSDGYRHFS